MRSEVGLCLILTLALSIKHAAGVGCISDSNQAVDWWFIYKLPSLTDNPSSNEGYGYAYIDSNTQSLNLSPRVLSSKTTGALSWTLNQIYNSDTVGYIMFNDQDPSGKSSTSRGHTKGVLGFTSRTGFLVRHSTPRFPYFYKQGYKGFPDYARIYGQTFLCMSLNIDTVSDLASQFMINMANVYDSWVPDLVANKYANITALGKNQMTNQIRSSVVKISTIGGQSFVDIAKSKLCQCEIYSDIVAPVYSTDILALTWGRPLTESYCKPKYEYDVANILNLTWVVNQTAYKETKEHSKWAIGINFATNGTPKGGPIVCVGDINRMESQRQRGGGLSCFTNKGLWNGFKSLIGSVASCPFPNSAQLLQAQDAG